MWISLWTLAVLVLRATLVSALWMNIALSSSRDVTDAALAAHVIRVGRDYAITQIAEAMQIARTGDVIEIEAGVYAGDIGIWEQSNLTIRATGGRARIVQKGLAAEGKAIWVIKGNDVVIENLEFAGAHVPDHNGAGIRHEGGKLTVRNCLFDGNEMGLLTWNNERSELVVERSEFRNNAVQSTYRRGDPIGHQIYVGSIARFTLRDSYIHHGAFGHLVKSRARENWIFNNRITDESGGKASYELELPNGGVAYVIGNIIEQSAQTQNEDVVSFGAEGYRWLQNELYLVNNTLVSELPHGGNFVHVKPGADYVEIVNNLLVGAARLDAGTAQKASGNVYAEPGDLPRAADYDYRLSREAKLFGSASDPGEAHGIKLRPEREYVHPMHSRSWQGPPLSPGARQSGLP